MREQWIIWWKQSWKAILRTHGHRATDTNKLFSYGAVTPILINTDWLRYRLMPHIYSLAWRVTHEDYTIHRLLIMDWRTNENIRNRRREVTRAWKRRSPSASFWWIRNTGSASGHRRPPTRKSTTPAITSA